MNVNGRERFVNDAIAVAPNMLIVDPGWRIIVSSGTDIWEASGLAIRIGGTVPPALQAIVSGALAASRIDPLLPFCVRISPWPDIAMTIYPVQSASERLIALTAQLFRPRKNLRHAQRAYGLSPRELEILKHVLGGSGTTQIAVALSIADSTVIAHVKSLLLKTKAANRAALVARVLGWEETLKP